jgi:hypothetical protein
MSEVAAAKLLCCGLVDVLKRIVGVVVVRARGE